MKLEAQSAPESPLSNGTRVLSDDNLLRRVSLVVPAKNEARNIPSVLSEIPDCVDEILVVDGNSRDATITMATSNRPDVRIVSEPRPGKGAALRAGFEQARGEVIVAMDADGSMSAAEIPTLLYFLDHGYDFVKGSRFVAGGGSLDITLLRRLGNRALLSLFNAVFEARLSDLCYGFFAFRRCFLDFLDVSSSGFEVEAELTAHALKAGLRIAEVPSMEMPRRSGHSSLRAVSDGTRVLRTLWRERPGGPGCVPTGRDPLGEVDGLGLRSSAGVKRVADPVTRGVAGTARRGLES